MTPSKIHTVDVPFAGPVPVAAADQVPLRVVARNNGVTVLTLAFSTQALGPPVQSEVFVLGVGSASEVFILQPNQRLFAISTAAAGLLAVAESEALPIAISGR